MSVGVKSKVYLDEDHSVYLQSMSEVFYVKACVHLVQKDSVASQQRVAFLVYLFSPWFAV